MVVLISDISPVRDELMCGDLEPQGSPPSSPCGPPGVCPRQKGLRRAVRFAQTVTFSFSRAGIQSDHEPRREEVEDLR
jgi:hypothetical protein